MQPECFLRNCPIRFTPVEICSSSRELNDRRIWHSRVPSCEKKLMGVRITLYCSAHCRICSAPNTSGAVTVRKKPPDGQFHVTCSSSPFISWLSVSTSTSRLRRSFRRFGATTGSSEQPNFVRIAPAIACEIEEVLTVVRLFTFD